MTEAELIKRNLLLAFGVLRSVVDDPTLGDKIDKRSEKGEPIVLYDAADADLTVANDEMVIRLKKSGIRTTGLRLKHTTTLASR